MAIVYQATNIVNGKRYVGVTARSLSVRRSQHLCDAKRGSQKRFHRALRKYTAAAFGWIVLAEYQTATDAIAAEIRLISELNPEYNVTSGGDGVKGLTHSMATRNKLSAAYSKERRIASSRRMSDLWKSDAFREKIHSAVRPNEQPLLRGLKRSPETVEKLRLIGLSGLDAWLLRSHLGPAAVSKPVICIDDGEKYVSASAAARAYGVAKSAVIELCLGKRQRKTVGGRRFSYVCS